MKRWLRGLLIALGVLLVILLVGPFLVPVPPLEGTVPPEQLADPDSRFAEVNGVNIHYKMAGEGEPVFILLHGFAASTFSWREVMGPLSEMGTVVAFDRPGFGLTERPMPGEWEGRSPYAPESQADLTVGLMDALGIERAVLVGNSAGGTVALLTALTYPERVGALVLVDAAIYVGGKTPGWLRPLFNTSQMRHLGPLLARQIRDWGGGLCPFRLARPLRPYSRSLGGIHPSVAGPELGSGAVGGHAGQPSTGSGEASEGSARARLGGHRRRRPRRPYRAEHPPGGGIAPGGSGRHPELRPHPAGGVPGGISAGVRGLYPKKALW